MKLPNRSFTTIMQAGCHDLVLTADVEFIQLAYVETINEAIRGQNHQRLESLRKVQTANILQIFSIYIWEDVINASYRLISPEAYMMTQT